MNTLCIDARWLYSGIGTYTLNLVRELRSRGEFELHLLTLPQHQVALRPFCDSLSIVNAPIYSLREQFLIPKASRGSSMLHVPHYNVPLLRADPLLVTIHDLTHILDARVGNTWKGRAYAQPMLRLAARRAAHIFTVSEYSKRHITEILEVADEKVTVTYNGVSPQFYAEPRDKARLSVQQAFGVTRPYILYVGNLKPHKNVEGLMRSFALLRSRTGGCELLIVGDGSPGVRTLKELAAKLRIDSVTRFSGRVSNEILRSAYSAAELTVLPSFEEGFGLPVLESMACGTPVACSRVASLPEVAGDAADYFDPHDVESMAGTLERIVCSSDLRERMRQRGFARAARFTWPDCVDRHLGVYHRHCQSLN